MVMCNDIVIGNVEHDGRRLGLPNAPVVMEHDNKRDNRDIAIALNTTCPYLRTLCRRQRHTRYLRTSPSWKGSRFWQYLLLNELMQGCYEDCSGYLREPEEYNFSLLLLLPFLSLFLL